MACQSPEFEATWRGFQMFRDRRSIPKPFSASLIAEAGFHRFSLKTTRIPFPTAGHGLDNKDIRCFLHSSGAQ
jgi:hypothetical protein